MFESSGEQLRVLRNQSNVNRKIHRDTKSLRFRTIWILHPVFMVCKLLSVHLFADGFRDNGNRSGNWRRCANYSKRDVTQSATIIHWRSVGNNMIVIDSLCPMTRMSLHDLLSPFPPLFVWRWKMIKLQMTSPKINSLSSGETFTNVLIHV